MPPSILNFSFDLSDNKPKYLQLADALERWISDNQFPDGYKFPSSRALSRRFNTTGSTVNHAMDQLVRRGLVTRIVGSGTQVKASFPASPKSVLGVFFHETITRDNCWTTPILDTLAELCEQNHWTMRQIVNLPQHYAAEAKRLELNAAVVLAPMKEHAEILRQFAQTGLPMAIIGVDVPGLEQACFYTDHATPILSSLKFLHEMGHRHFAMVLHDLSNPGEETRRAVFLEGLWELQLPFNPAWLLQFSRERLDALKQMKQLKETGNLPTALLIAQHSLIVPVYEACSKLDIKIPQDLSIVAFDNPDYSAILTPPLSVWEQNPGQMARDAFQSILDQARNIPQSGKCIQSIFVERGSCAPPRQKSLSCPSVPWADSLPGLHLAVHQHKQQQENKKKGKKK